MAKKKETTYWSGLPSVTKQSKRTGLQILIGKIGIAQFRSSILYVKHNFAIFSPLLLIKNKEERIFFNQEKKIG